MIRTLAFALAALSLAQAPAHACAITTFSTPYWSEPKAGPGEVALEVDYIGKSSVTPKVPPNTIGTDVPVAHRFRVKSVAAGQFTGAEVLIIEVPVCHYLTPQKPAFARNYLIGRIRPEKENGVPVLIPHTERATE